MSEHANNMSHSAAKILNAAIDLFASDNFNAVSIKQIAVASGVNSALISYYFGGKKNLYQAVLNTQSEVFFHLIDNIRTMEISPLSKLHHYVHSIVRLQKEHPHCIHLIYRELLSPQPMFENFVKNRLYRIHQFMTELVAEAIERKEISSRIQPTHVAFTLESIIMFFFLTHNQIRDLGNFMPGNEIDYLTQALNTYLASLS